MVLFVRWEIPDTSTSQPITYENFVTVNESSTSNLFVKLGMLRGIFVLALALHWRNVESGDTNPLEVCSRSCGCGPIWLNKFSMGTLHSFKHVSIFLDLFTRLQRKMKRPVADADLML